MVTPFWPTSSSRCCCETPSCQTMFFETGTEVELGADMLVEKEGGEGVRCSDGRDRGSAREILTCLSALLRPEQQYRAGREERRQKRARWRRAESWMDGAAGAAQGRGVELDESCRGAHYSQGGGGVSE